MLGNFHADADKLARYGTAWHGMARHGTAWYGGQVVCKVKRMGGGFGGKD